MKTKMKGSNSRIFQAVCLLWMLAITTTCLHAQITTGTVTGTVTDSTGAVVSGAQIALTNDATGFVQNTISTSTGTYVFHAVPPGTYSLKVDARGFGPSVNRDLVVNVQQTITKDVSLSPGAVVQEVTVTGGTQILQSEDASLGQTLTTEAVNDMPLEGRDWNSLSNLAVGVVTSGGTIANATMFISNGADESQNDYRLDGINNNEEFFGGSHINSNGLAVIDPPPDAVQDVKLQTGNYSAQFGHSTGAVVNAVIKSGANRPFGDVWEFNRNTVFNANDYFNNHYNEPRPAYHQNNFGGTFGGPVFIPHLYDGRNKTFFFVDYDGDRISTPSSFTDTVPTTNMVSSGFTNLQDMFVLYSGSATDALGRTFPHGTILDPETTRIVAAGAVDPVSGLPNPNPTSAIVRDPFYSGGSIAGIKNFTGLTQNLNQLPANRLDPNAIKLLGLYPAPNLSLGGSNGANDYRTNRAYTNTSNQYDVRLDEQYGAKDTLFAVISQEHYNAVQPYPFPGLAAGGGWGTGTSASNSEAFVLSDTHTFTPTFSNEFHVGFMYNTWNETQPEASDLTAAATFNIGNIPQLTDAGGLPPITIGGFSSLGGAGWMPTLISIGDLEFMDNLTKVHAGHTFTWGFQADKLHGTVIQDPYPIGNFSFNGQYSDIPNQTSSFTGVPGVGSSSTGFNGITDLLLIPGTSTVPGGINNLGGLQSFDVSAYGPIHDQRMYYGAYFQDDWKLTPRLTLNLGLRWDYFQPYTEANGRQANFIQDPGGTPTGTFYMAAKTCNTPENPMFSQLLAQDGIAVKCVADSVGTAQKGNFAPRVGFELRVTPRTVARAAFGISYGALDTVGVGPNIGGNYPFLYTIYETAPGSQAPLLNAAGQTSTLENALVPLGNFESPTVFNGQYSGLDGRTYNFQTPYMETYNLTIQKQISNNDTVQAGYVGNVGRHLDTQGSQNTPQMILPPGTNYNDPTVTGHIPFPNFAEGSTFQTTSSISSYNSLQMVYQHTITRGLTFTANYTFSRCLSDQTSGYGYGSAGGIRAEWLPGFGLRKDYALCSFDSANVLHAMTDWAIPLGKGGYFASSNPAVNSMIGGWKTSMVFVYQSGNPITVGCTIATTAGFGCNAPLVPGQSTTSGPHNIHQWLNPSAFVNPAPATVIGQTDYSPLGVAGGQARGPHYDDVDFSLFKDFPIAEALKVEVRGDAFNLLNSPSFSNPGNLNFTEPTNFAQITGTRSSARIVQLSGKFYF